MKLGETSFTGTFTGTAVTESGAWIEIRVSGSRIRVSWKGQGVAGIETVDRNVTEGRSVFVMTR